MMYKKLHICGLRKNRQEIVRVMYVMVPAQLVTEEKNRNPVDEMAAIQKFFPLLQCSKLNFSGKIKSLLWKPLRKTFARI